MSSRYLLLQPSAPQYRTMPGPPCAAGRTRQQPLPRRRRRCLETFQGECLPWVRSPTRRLRRRPDHLGGSRLDASGKQCHKMRSV